MHPYPAQGSKREGFPTADIALQNALRLIKNKEKKERRLALRKQHLVDEEETSPTTATVLRLARNFQQRRLRPVKPYGITVAIPVYLFLAFFTRALGRVVWNTLASKPWAQPIVIPLQHYVTIAAAFLVSHLRIVQQFLQQFLSFRVPLPFIGKLFAPKQYISF
jgi:hypothetical protein